MRAHARAASAGTEAAAPQRGAPGSPEVVPDASLTPLRARPPAPGELARQAMVIRAIGSPFVAEILEAGERNLIHGPRTAALIAGWQGDASAAALAMRFNGALHALARRGRPPVLAALYRRLGGDFDAAVAAALAGEDAFIAEWMRDPPQTNEVSRAGAIVAALMVVRARFGMPFELLELGSSAGLNLNLARYAYSLGGRAFGVAQSPVRIAPEWRGAPPPAGALDVRVARGVDLHPLDVANPATRERLLAYVFADQPARAERLRAALALAQRHSPRIDRDDAAHWLAARLRRPQREDRCRVVFHSMVLQYLGGAGREAVQAAIAQAGAGATDRRPLAWIGFEWTQSRSEVQLRLTCWPGGDTRVLAVCHPYGAWIDWRA